MIKIGFYGNLPAASVLPEECIRPSHRKGSHPAPWIAALLPQLAKMGGYQLRMFLVQKAVLKHTVYERDGIEFEAIPYPGPERWNARSLHLFKSLLVNKAVKEFDPDFIHAFGMETGAASVALRTGYPVSCFLQGISEKLFPYYKQRPYVDRLVSRWNEGWAVKRVPWMVAETEFAKDWALLKNPDAHVDIIPHPLREVFFDLAAPRFERKIVSIGGLDDRKGMDTVIKAFALLKDSKAHLSIVGGGPLRSDLEELACNLGVTDQVTFTGNLETEDVINELNSASALVIASRMDTSPNVVSEAHAVGIPVIGTRAGGIPEMINEGKDGYHVDIDDAEAMSKYMGILLSDTNVAAQLGLAGQTKVRSLNDAQAVGIAHHEYFQRIYRELTAVS
tara:strand:- start:381 stop:1556 length:1176 start_codon:yes stop_codon:yes gene_type:complete